MRVSKPLMAAFATLLLISVVLSMVTVSVSEDKEDPAPSIRVPVGMAGDEVSYGRYNLIGQLKPDHSFRLEGPVETRDQDLKRVQAVNIHVHNQDAGMGPGLHHEETVRLSDRLVFKISASHSNEGETHYGLGRTDQWQKTQNLSVYQVTGSSLPGLSLQGKELTFGQEVPLVFPEHSRLSVLGHTQARGGTPVPLNDHARIVEHGLADRDPDPPVIQHYKVAEKGTLDGQPVLGVVVPQDGPGDITKRVYWFSEQVPYPVLIETRFSSDEPRLQNGEMISGEEYAWKTVLTDYTPGHTPIDWDTPAPPRDLETDERIGLRPADGTGTQLPYPLTEAIQHTKESRMDPLWVLWQLQNPDAELVSATLTKGASPTEGAMQWRLVFMGTTNAFEVRTEHHPQWSTPIVEGLGQSDVPINQYTRPAPALTLSAIVDLWHETQAVADTEPDYLHWGLIPENHRRSKLCGILEGTTSIDIDPETLLDQARIGTSAHGPCISDEQTFHYDTLTLDIARPALITESQITDGRTTTLNYAGPRPDADDTPPTFAPHEEPRPSARFSTEVHPPDLERGAVVAIPLILTLIAVYFYPTLQFAATKGLLLVPLFSRIKRSDVLDHTLRDRLHALIQENPGITPTRIKQETGLGWGTIVHHLTVLEREDIIASKIGGRYRRFYLAQEIPPKERASRDTLANERTQKLYTRLLEHPGLATPELAEHLGITSPGALWHLKRLEENGLVERRRDGKRMRYYATEA